MTTAKARPDRLLAILLSVIAALVLISLIVVFTRGAAKPLDESTPAGVVQRYVTAVLASDDAVATALLAPDARAKCAGLESSPTEGLRVTLLSVDEHSDSAEVSVSIAVSNVTGPFGSPEYANDETFELSRVDGAWLVSRAPWQMQVCDNQGVWP